MSGFKRWEDEVAAALLAAGVDDVGAVTMAGHRVFLADDALVSEVVEVAIFLASRNEGVRVVVRDREAVGRNFTDVAVAKLLAKLASLGHIVDQRTVPGCCE